MEFDLPGVSEYLVRTWLVWDDKFKLKESTTIIRSLLMEEWWGKEGSQELSQILIKLSVMIRRFWIFASVSFRYFKAKWEESE